MLDDFIEHINEPFVQVIEVDRDIGLTAHQFCRQYTKLYPNDAIHLACALRGGCDVLLAWDGPLSCVSHPGIRIEAPIIYERTLFSEDELATPEEIKAYDNRERAKSLAAQCASNLAGMAKVHATRDALADQIVDLRKAGKLPIPFTSRQIKILVGEQPPQLALQNILPDYCKDGKQVLSGGVARFERVSRGSYTIL